MELPRSSLAAFGKSPAARGSRDGPMTPPKRRSAAGTALGRSWGAVDGHCSGEGGPSWLVLVWGGVGELVGTRRGRWAPQGGPGPTTSTAAHALGALLWALLWVLLCVCACGVSWCWCGDSLGTRWALAGHSLGTRVGSVGAAPEGIAAAGTHPTDLGAGVGVAVGAAVGGGVRG